MFAPPKHLLALPPVLQQRQTPQQHHVSLWRPTLIQAVELQEEVQCTLVHLRLVVAS